MDRDYSSTTGREGRGSKNSPSSRFDHSRSPSESSANYHRSRSPPHRVSLSSRGGGGGGGESTTTGSGRIRSSRHTPTKDYRSSRDGGGRDGRDDLSDGRSEGWPRSSRDSDHHRSGRPSRDRPRDRSRGRSVDTYGEKSSSNIPTSTRSRDRSADGSRERSREKSGEGSRRGISRERPRESETHEKRRRRTGWDDVPSATPQDPSDTTITSLGKTSEQLEKELQERQVQAANIAALMQTKASLSQLCRIYVGSLDYSLTETDIRSVFSAFGQIVNIDMPKEGARSKGFCFVEYTLPEAAEMALQTMQGFILKGRSIKVGRPTALGGQMGGSTGTAAMISGMIPPQANSTHVSLPGVADDLSAAQAGVVAAASLIASRPSASPIDPSLLTASINAASSAMPPSLIPATIPQSLPMHAGGLGTANAVGAVSPAAAQLSRVYVGSVPYSFTAEDVKQIFTVFGQITSCQLIPSNERPGTHRGYGFIEFASMDQSKLAIETMNGFEVGGKQLKVNYATALRNAPLGGAMHFDGASPSAAFASIPPAAATGANAVMVKVNAAGATDLDTTTAQPPPSEFAHSPTILLANIVGPDEVDESLKEEITSECRKYGHVVDAVVEADPSNVNVYVTFSTAAEAAAAVPQLHCRWFDGRQIFCKQVIMPATAVGAVPPSTTTTV